MNDLTPAQQSFLEFVQSALIQLDEQERTTPMKKNIGVTNGNWRGGERPTLDDAEFQFTNLEWMQVKLDIANNFICRPHFPDMLERGKVMAAEVVADVMAMLDAEMPALYVPGVRVLSVMDGVK